MHVQSNWRGVMNAPSRTFYTWPVRATFSITRHKGAEMRRFGKFCTLHQNCLALRLSKRAYKKTVIAVLLGKPSHQSGHGSSLRVHKPAITTRHVAPSSHWQDSAKIAFTVSQHEHNTFWELDELRCKMRDAMTSGVKYETAQRCQFSNTHPTCSCVVPFVFI